MEKYVKLTVSFIKRQYYPHLLLVLAFVLVSGGFVSFRNLEEAQTAKVMEMYVALTGILLFTPLFMAEQDKEIWDLEKSRQTPMWVVYMLRLLTALLVFTAVIASFILFMVQGNSSFDAGRLFWGSFCEILFLGSIGFFVSAITNQVVIGYMLAFIYYACNIGGGKVFDKLALFQMMKGEYGSWIYWISGAVFLLVSGMLLRERKK